MANTTNFGWETPDDTDLVKDGAAAMRTLGNSIDASFVDLKGGTTGQILSKNSNTDLDYIWINNDQGDITAVTAGTGISGGGTSGAVTITNSMATEITASGDIIVGTGSGTFDNLPIGTTGQVLTADTTVSPYKVKWASPSAAAFVGCRAYNSAAQTISHNTDTLLTFDTESFDTDAFHSTSTNTGRMTIPSGKAGKYLVQAAGVMGTNTSGFRYMYIRKNGSSTQYSYGSAYAGGDWSMQINNVMDLVVGDYIEIMVYQGSGSNQTFDTRLAYGWFSVTYLGA